MEKSDETYTIYFIFNFFGGNLNTNLFFYNIDDFILKDIDNSK